MIFAAVANNRHVYICTEHVQFFSAYTGMPAGHIFYLVHLYFLRILTEERILEWFLVYFHQFTNLQNELLCLLLVAC